MTEAYANSATLLMGALGLAKGGYALGKGVIGFNKLARTPIQAVGLVNQVRKPSLLEAEKIIERLETFLGKDSRLFKNIHGDLLIESKNGLKQFRMDLSHPKPHKNPHIHLIEYEIRKIISLML